MGWIILIPASLLVFTENVIAMLEQMKVNGMATSISNVYISLNVFLTNQLFILPNFRGCTWVHDSSERVLTWRAPAIIRHITCYSKDSWAYDVQLHSSMQSFWDLFSTGEYMQKITCTRCNTTTSETKESFSKLMLHFPPSHHEGDHHTCTLNELIRHHNETAEIDSYQCSICNTQTIASSERMISQYPKIMCIVLSRWGPNDTKNDSAVTYPLQGLFGSVHHKMNRGKSGHYIAIWIVETHIIGSLMTMTMYSVCSSWTGKMERC